MQEYCKQRNKKNTELEQCLARKLLAAVKHEAELNAENNDLFEKLFSTFNGLVGSKFAERMKEKRRKNLKALSKQRFKEAVNLNAESKDE